MSVDFNELYELCKKKTDELFAAAGEDNEERKKAIALKVKTYRIRKRLSQAELAEKLCVSKMQVIRWEHAENMPSRLALERMKQVGIM
jgi:DNA-binding transcriptional regulator YiaG